MKNQALIMVDLQNDFCAGGSLAVPGADEIMPLANQLQNQFDIVFATKDWHPVNHISFASNHEGKAVGEVIAVNDMPQVLWPVHCVQHKKGADFHPALRTDKIQQVFYKGTDPLVDSYSAFFDNAHLRSTGLGDFLKNQGIDTIYLIGLATDYCVKFTCLDALQLGFKVYLIEEACRGVGINENDIKNAWADMYEKGAQRFKVS